MEIEKFIDSRIESYRDRLLNLKEHRAEVCDKLNDAENEALDLRIRDFAQFVKDLRTISDKLSKYNLL